MWSSNRLRRWLTLRPLRERARRFIPVQAIRTACRWAFLWSSVKPWGVRRRLRRSDYRVLVLGVYMADRPNAAAHLHARFDAEVGITVEQRWVALNGAPPSDALRRVTPVLFNGREPKFSLLNRLLTPADIDNFDFVVACDDDIHLPRNFLRTFFEYQEQFDFSIAQPARALHSYYDHSFVLRRPWLLARETRFVECGPFVSLRRDAARVLLPFDSANQMWGIDLVWPKVMSNHGLKMGIIDATPIDHSLRAQGVTYDKQAEWEVMHAYLAETPHLSFKEALTVVRKYPRYPTFPTSA